MSHYTDKEFLDFLLERFRIERKKFDRSGVYASTQRYKIEGSTLTKELTASLFDNGTLFILKNVNTLYNVNMKSLAKYELQNMMGIIGLEDQSFFNSYQKK